MTIEAIRGEIRAAGFWFWFWLCFLGAVVTLYLWQPDFAFALTIYSPWVPALLGFALTSIPAARRRSKPLALVAFAWCGWGLLASEEFRGLARSTPGEADFQGFRYDGKRVRIVSLNCAGGAIEAAREVASWEPDIVLLQESPGRPELERLARELFGEEASLIVGPDASILSRYPLQSLHEGKREPINYVSAFAQVAEDERWMVVSLRLQPPVLRFDYWNPACWSAYAEGKSRRRKELEEVWRDVGNFSEGEPLIVGGDFNAPPDRSLRKILEPRLSDSVRLAGKGWGATATSFLPMVRIDQIWLDRQFEPLRTISAHAEHSDHRMVVCDFMRRG